MHPQLHMLITQDHIADMHRDAARARLTHQAAGAAQRSQRAPTARIKITPGRMTAPFAHAGVRAEMSQPEGR